MHVLTAVLLIGPFALAPYMAHRAIRRHDASNTHAAARILAVFSTGSLIVAAFGFGALSTANRYSFRTPWVIISITLYVIAMGIATGYTMPSIRRAAGVIEQGVLERPPAAAEGDGEAPPPTLAATATDLAAKERLDNLAGRVVASGTVVFVLIVLITIFMIVRPFGR
nr:DUF2269 family protein [Planosporangium thailandense]